MSFASPTRRRGITICLLKHRPALNKEILSFSDLTAPKRATFGSLETPESYFFSKEVFLPKTAISYQWL